MEDYDKKIRRIDQISVLLLITALILITAIIILVRGDLNDAIYQLHEKYFK